MATPSPKKSSAAQPDAAPKPAFRPSPFALVDLSSGSVSRQVRIDKDTYGRIEELRTDFRKLFASELGEHRLTLEEMVVLCVQAGAVALAQDAHAPRKPS